MNYKLRDRERIMEYISAQGGAVEVEDLLLHSGAERLRVYPILFELEQEGWLLVTEREGMGSPKLIMKNE